MSKYIKITVITISIMFLDYYFLKGKYSFKIILEMQSEIQCDVKELFTYKKAKAKILTLRKSKALNRESTKSDTSQDRNVK